MATLLLIVTAVLLALTYLLRCLKRPLNFPPGPPWFPIVGCMSVFKNRIKEMGSTHLALESLAEEYKTNVLGLKLGRDQFIVVFGVEAVKTVLIGEVYEGRPDSFFIRLRSMGTRKGITCTDGEHWHEQRTFVMRHLRDVGFGKKPMEMKIGDELQNLLNVIDTNGPVIKVVDLFAPSVLSVLWALTAGSRLSRDDTRLHTLLSLIYRRGRAFDMSGGSLSQLPWLRFIAPEKSGYNLLVSLNKELKNFFMDTIKEHHQNYNESTNDDLIYAFIKEMRLQEGRNSRFTDDQLMMVCLDLFIAGSETTSASLGFLFLIMVLRPDIQKKAREELDRVVLENQTPTLADRANLPYIEAVLAEVRRFFTPAPTLGPRRVLKDTTIDKFNIPKDTTVLISLWSIHMNKMYWKDPYLFNPDRFIGPDGKYKSNDLVLTFGLGRRRCPGEVLARSCIFLFFTGILQRYEIENAPNCPQPSMKPLAGITLTPQPYSMKLVRRM